VDALNFSENSTILSSLSRDIIDHHHHYAALGREG
jgi:hypothetical protein